MSNFLYPIWFFFTAIFLYLAYMQYRLSKEPLRTFYMREHATELGESKDGDRVEMLTKDAVEDFNQYLVMINERNKKHYTASAVGYFVASFLALVSMFIMLSAS